MAPIKTMAKRYRYFFTRTGHKGFRSQRAKEAFSKHLIGISEKLFLAAVLPYISYMLRPEEVRLVQVFIGTIVFVLGAIYTRQAGLQVLDDLEANRLEVINANEVR